jgi:hypothetical protein
MQRVFGAFGKFVQQFKAGPVSFMRSLRRRRLARLSCSKQPVTLFLAPDAGVTPFYATHAVLARLMIESGHAAVMLSCRGIKASCSVKLAMKLRSPIADGRNNAACVLCRRNSAAVGHDYALPDIPLESLLDADDYRKIDDIIQTSSPEPWKAVHDNIEFGGACLGETLRANGKLEFDELDAADVLLIKALLQASLAVYFAVAKTTKLFNVDRIVYFGDYAYYLPVQLLAKRGDIALTHISHGYNRDIDRRYISLLPGFSFDWARSQVGRWDEFAEIPITPAAVDAIFDGAVFRLHGHGGVSTFSPNWQLDQGDVLDRFEFDPRRKTIVAFASSFDEVACIRNFMRFFRRPFEIEPRPFENQTVWLQALSRWVGERNDLQLIIRLHPRMAANVRSSGAARQHAKIRAALADVPRNVTVVAADSPLSSYNIAEMADVALVAWSSMGIELARFGVPVVAAFPEIAVYPTGSFVRFAPTEADYFREIEQSLSRALGIGQIVEAFRWTHFLCWSHLVDVSDIIPQPDYNEVPDYRTPRNAERLLKALTGGSDIVVSRMAELSLDTEAVRAERAAVLEIVERLIWYLMSGVSIEKCPRLRIVGSSTDTDDEYQDRARDMSMLILYEGQRVSLVVHGNATQRLSPLVHRLGRILATERSCAGELTADVRPAGAPAWATGE